jgi:putative membrane protein
LPAFARSLIVANFVCGIEIQGFGSALIGALVVGVVNALVRPVMMRLTSPLTIITFGLFLLVINGPMRLLVSRERRPGARSMPAASVMRFPVLCPTGRRTA